jgi:hypothetical protein
MKRCAVIFCATAVLAMPVLVLAADEKPAAAQKEGRVVAETMVAKHATVKAIDMDKRTVTLEMPDGKERMFVIDKRVKKLNQVKVGDTVKATYYEAVSVKINKTKVPSGVTVEGAIGRDEKSVKPAGVAARQVTTTATIEKIFDDAKMVTLQMPDGKTVDVKVRDKVNREKLKKGEVKVGDQIEITYTQALAISVEKIAK